MDKIILRTQTIHSNYHWATPNAFPTVISTEKTVEVSNVAAIKYRHEASGFLWSEAYDAIDYDGKRYKLTFDVAENAWIAVHTDRR